MIGCGNHNSTGLGPGKRPFHWLTEDNEDEVYAKKEASGMNKPARCGFTAFCLISISVLTCTFSTIAWASAPINLLPQPLFSRQSGWFFRGAWPDPKSDQSHGAAARLDGVPANSSTWSHVGGSLNAIPTGRKLTFSCLLKGSADDQKVMVNAFAYDKANHLIKNWSTATYLDTNKWRDFESEYVAPEKSASFTLWVIDQEPHPCYVAKASLIAGKVEKEPREEAGNPEVISAHAQTAVQLVEGAQTGVVTFPIPGEYREQVPLTFAVSAQPGSALVSYRIHQREDGRNWLCEVTVRPPPVGAIVGWDALVLVAPHKNVALPKTMPASTSEVASWLRSTACVQSDDPDIIAKSRQIGSDSDDVETYARKVIDFTSKNNGNGARIDALDARRALDCGGSCTSRANLAAALLRAHRIPARTLAHLPTWSGPLDEHWLVEYWHPNSGWVWLESTMNKFEPKPTSLVVLAESNPDDEDKAFDAIQLRNVMPGAAYFSIALLCKELIAAQTLDTPHKGRNVAITQGQIKGSPEQVKGLFRVAEREFAQLTRRSANDQHEETVAKAVRSAAHAGSAALVLAALTGSTQVNTSAVSVAQTSPSVSNESQSNVQPDSQENEYRAAMEVSRKKNGYSHPETLRAMWNLSHYYLKTGKFAQAESVLRYLNDASAKNAKNAPYTSNDIARAYAEAVRGIHMLQGNATIASTKKHGDINSDGATTHSANKSKNSSTSVGSWYLSGDSPTYYQVGLDGYSYIKARTDSAPGFATLMQTTLPNKYQGKRIRFSAKVKTDNVVKAQLWLRVDQPDGTRQIDNMGNRPIMGTTDWARYECVMDVPAGSSNIAFGLILTTSGKAWIDDATIEEVGQNVATTDMN
jgi:hypothetical protein